MNTPKISFLNYAADESIFRNDLIVVKGVVAQEEEGEEDDAAESNCNKNNWAQDLEIIQNSSTTIPFKAENTAFIFATNLTPGMNEIKFVGKNNACWKAMSLTYEPLQMVNQDENYSVIPLLVLCRDDNRPDNMIRDITMKIELIMKLMQTFFEEKLYEHGLSKKSFNIKRVEILRSELQARMINEMSAEQLWEKLACQIRSSRELWSPRNKFVAFTTTHCKLNIQTQGQSPDRLACGGGGLALLGFDTFELWAKNSASLLDAMYDPGALDDLQLLETGHGLCLPEPRTRGSLFCATMGALAHELGHIFDLGHSEAGLMGKDFLKFRQFFSPVTQLKTNCFGCSNMSVGRRDSRKINIRKNSDITLTHSSATILFYHRWFAQNNAESEHKDTLIFSRNRISTSLGTLVAAEIRDPLSGLVYKTFELGTENKELILSKRDVLIQYGEKARLFVESSNGDSLSVEVFRDNLPTMFTNVK